MIYRLTFLYFLLIIISLIFVQEYKFNKVYFILLSIICNAYFLMSFLKKIHLFHLFNSFFLWMGFWFKIILVSYFFNFKFAELNIQSLIFFDKAIIVSIIGISGFFLSLILNLFFFPLNYSISTTLFDNFSFSKFLKKNKNLILFIFVFFILTINFFNFKFSIYQRGVIDNQNIIKLVLINFKWLLLFGLSSLSTIIIFHSLFSNNLSKKILIVSILENFITSISMLSRGMFVNFMAILFGIIKFYQFIKFKKFKEFLITSLLTFSILFFLSITIVKELRNEIYFTEQITSNITDNTPNKKHLSKLKSSYEEIFRLISHRFVGFDSVLAVASYPKKNMEFFISTFVSPDMSNAYTTEIMKIKTTSQLNNININFIKVPGIIAYLYYSGSLIFIFLVCLFIGLFLSYFEKFVIKFSNGNIIFGSLISQVLAYRLSNFGYLPSNTYLIFLTILFNLFAIYIFYLLLNKFKKLK